MFITKPKLYIIIKNNIVVDGWFAKNFKEAQQDNPSATVVELKLGMKFATLGLPYKG